jgi:glycosyltransferase involved in cell wall biosynthesis
MMVEEGISGHLTKPDNSRALAEALVKLSIDTKKRESMGKASFALFTKKFHASTMAEHVERIYVSAIQSGTSTPVRSYK